MGCFWKPSEELLKVEGVLDTVCGYTGKADVTTPPTYDDVCFGRKWVEAVRVEYDEEKLTYHQLLDAFFEAQVPKVGSRQYGSIIFPHDDNQDRAAQEWLQQNSNRVRASDGLTTAITQVEARTPFFRAEQYHQRYWQKMRPRIAGMVGLLAVSTGILDGLTPGELQSSVHTGANSIVLLGMLLVLLERKIDTKTVELS